MLKLIFVFAMLAFVSSEMNSTYPQEGSGEVYEGEPLTFKEINSMAFGFKKAFKGMSGSLTPFLKAPDADEIQVGDIFHGLMKANKTFGLLSKLTQAMNEDLDDAERRADIFGFPLALPCGAAIKNLMEEMSDMHTFEDLVMFWEAVQLDIRCIRGYMKDLKSNFKFFQNVDEGTNILDFMSSVYQLRFYIGHISGASHTLQAITAVVAHGIQEKMNMTTFVEAQKYFNPNDEKPESGEKSSKESGEESGEMNGQPGQGMQKNGGQRKRQQQGDKQDKGQPQGGQQQGGQQQGGQQQGGQQQGGQQQGGQQQGGQQQGGQQQGGQQGQGKGGQPGQGKQQGGRQGKRQQQGGNETGGQKEQGQGKQQGNGHHKGGQHKGGEKRTWH